MTKGKAFEEFVLKGGVITEIATGPRFAMSEFGIAACNRTLLLKVVARAAPFQSTTEFRWKLVPLTVSVNPRPPPTAELGVREVIAGANLAASDVRAQPEVNAATPRRSVAKRKRVSIFLISVS